MAITITGGAFAGRNPVPSLNPDELASIATIAGGEKQLFSREVKSYRVSQIDAGAD